MADERKDWGSTSVRIDIMEVNKVNSPVSATQAIAPAQADTKLQTTPEMAQAVTAVNGAKLFGQDSELTFTMDRESKRTIIRLVDRKTRQIIRQIPAEYILRMAEDLPKTMG
jgi:flagellar protein FlaG